MTRIDFYILASSEAQERVQFACRLIEKAYKLGRQLYVHTDDEQTTASIDDALWQYRADSFIPHQRIDQQPATPAPIEIGHQHDPKQHQDILINLAHETPAFFSRFERVAELVLQQPESLAASRKSYAFYRDRGYPMKTHDMRKK
ncbi:MAG: DNA polymerase III subunit chi [Pseudomonadales bacterium]|nr:DNA polymerase III subunit chi [Pseudomonadales bacterium]MCP5215860.1 DNA polymerase III subunit chi [Pseudomonadales bacterium]